MRKLEVTALDLARRFVGTKELSGHAANPQILAMLQLEDRSAQEDEIAWCSAFVNYVAFLLGLPRSGKLSARSWLAVGASVDLHDASPGFDVVIFKRGMGPQPGPEVLDAPGHVAFFVSTDLIYVQVLGGNQADTVNVAPFLASNVLGVRRLLV